MPDSFAGNVKTYSILTLGLVETNYPQFDSFGEAIEFTRKAAYATATPLHIWQTQATQRPASKYDSGYRSGGRIAASIFPR